MIEPPRLPFVTRPLTFALGHLPSGIFFCLAGKKDLTGWSNCGTKGVW